MTRVLHVISSLEVGGAETALLRLVRSSDRRAFEPLIVSLTSETGPIGDELRSLGVAVRGLHATPWRGIPNPLRLRLLAEWMREFRADVIQTWMYHSNLAGGLAAAAVGRPCIWCIRQADLDGRISLRTRAYARLGGLLSRRLPARIIYNSEAGMRSHVAAGYAGAPATVVTNGFDLDVFKPDAAARLSLRRELGLADDAILVGLAARFDPQKDHRTFFAAAALLRTRRPAAHFVLCGAGVTGDNPAIAAMLGGGGDGCFHLLGHRADTPRINAALDVACLSSRGEGFPNTVGEAMACGVPCAATDVGDTARIVGDCGRVVPARDPAALAGAIEALLAMAPEARRTLGIAGRERIRSAFDIRSTTAAYEAVWRDLAGTSPVRAP